MRGGGSLVRTGWRAEAREREVRREIRRRDVGLKKKSVISVCVACDLAGVYSSE
jgi:hypothetical protein